MLSVIVLSVAFLFTTLLNVVMLSVFLLSVFLLSVVEPLKWLYGARTHPKYLIICIQRTQKWTFLSLQNVRLGA